MFGGGGIQNLGHSNQACIITVHDAKSVSGPGNKVIIDAGETNNFIIKAWLANVQSDFTVSPPQEKK